MAKKLSKTGAILNGVKTPFMKEKPGSQSSAPELNRFIGIPIKPGRA
jgi:hypothetical protein